MEPYHQELSARVHTMERFNTEAVAKHSSNLLSADPEECAFIDEAFSFSDCSWLRHRGISVADSAEMHVLPNTSSLSH